MKWLRLWAEMLDDEAVQQLPLSVFKVWIDLLCATGERDGVPVTPEQLAFRVRARKSRVKTGIDHLVSVGLVVTRNGKVKPRNWRRYQYKSDDSTARVKRFRERSGNVAETPPDPEERRGEKRRDPDPEGVAVSRQAFLSAETGDRVARLIDLGRCLGFEGDERIAAAIIRDYGESGEDVPDAMELAKDNAEGSPWKYAKGVLRNGRTKQAGRGNARRRQDSLATTPAAEAKAKW